MKILVVSQYFWPENFRINDLVMEMIERQHDVTVLTAIPNYPEGKVFEDYLENPSKFNEFHGAKVFRAPIFRGKNSNLRLILNYVSFIFGGIFRGAISLYGVQPDIIFVFQPSPVTVGLPALWISKVKKTPVVFWVLDLWPETLSAVDKVQSPFILKLIEYLVKYIYRRCTLILGQSRTFVDEIAKYCDDKTKIHYFPSWAEDTFITSDLKKIPNIIHSQNCFTILFAGNVGEAQDFTAILEAAEILKNNDSNIRWIIVGNGNKFDWLKTEIVRRGLQNKILLPGYFQIEDMPSIYSYADALLVSLKKNNVFSKTIPGKVQSYLLSGKPILGMLDGEGATVIKNAKAGLVCEAGDSNALARLVLKLVALSPEERKQMGLNGIQYSNKEFNRVQLMDKLELFFHQAVTKYKR